MVKAHPSPVQGLGLGDGAGHPVQNEAVDTVGLLQPLTDDADDHVIRDQLAGVHIGLGQQPGLGAFLNGGAQDIAGGDRRDAQLGTEDLSLGAFPGSGGTQKDQFHAHLSCSCLTPGSPYNAA